MSINFTKNVEQYTTAQKATRVRHFTEYTSKKQLEDSGILNGEDLEFVKSIKGTFSFSIHEGARYIAITLYKASNNERKYNFLVVDLAEKAVAEVDSIKNAKAAIMELVGEAQQETECATAEEVEQEKKPARRRKKSDVKEETVEA